MNLLKTVQELKNKEKGNIWFSKSKKKPVKIKLKDYPGNQFLIKTGLLPVVCGHILHRTEEAILINQDPYLGTGQEKAWIPKSQIQEIDYSVKDPRKAAAQNRWFNPDFYYSGKFPGPQQWVEERKQILEGGKENG